MSVFDPIKPYLSLVKTGLFVACVAAAFVYGCSRGHEKGVRAGAAAVAKLREQQDNERVRFALEHAKAMEEQAKRYQTRAEAMSATATQYQEALTNANRKNDRTVADLRAGTLRFRKLWEDCSAAVPAPGEAAPGGRSPDEGAELRAASAGRIIGAGAECDAQVIGLQKILMDERQ